MSVRGRSRLVVEREVRLNRAEIAFLRAALKRAVNSVPQENDLRWLMDILPDRIDRKLQRALENWSQP